ncbi:MAG: hypothetical protein OXI08_11095, partial [Cyanobacteria bacterium MAG IRC4_bin_6]|nr:hypothetical protein [Cyanobacteria bacterium MAG IRC4_bin_6]
DLLLRDLPDATTLMGDKGLGQRQDRTRLLEQGVTPCIPSRRNRNKRLYKRHTVGNLFAKLKDWRPSATRYHRRASIFLSAVLLGATLISWFSCLNLATDTSAGVRSSQ